MAAEITSSTYIDRQYVNEEDYYELVINHSFELIRSYWGSEDSDPGLSHARHDSNFTSSAQIYLITTSGGEDPQETGRVAQGVNINGPGQEYSTWNFPGINNIDPEDIVYSNAEGIVPSNVFIFDSTSASESARMYGNYFDLFPGSGTVFPNTKNKANVSIYVDASGKRVIIPNYWDTKLKTYSRLDYVYAANSDFIDVQEFRTNTAFGVLKNYTFSSLPATPGSNGAVSFTVPIYVVNNLDYSRDFVVELVSRAKQALFNNLDNKPIIDIRTAPKETNIKLENAGGSFRTPSADAMASQLYAKVPVLKTEAQLEKYKANNFSAATEASIKQAASVSNVVFGNTEFQPAFSNTNAEGVEPAITTSSNTQINIVVPGVPESRKT